ncbi:MAG: CDP-diacylglycerol--serine O-phosphatidyltransferase [Nitrospirae bacterium]|nr:CDP-diacylglycerol--serine O-phosphatidyltransferase [Candidatus Troglogloeales bacterium]
MNPRKRRRMIELGKRGVYLLPNLFTTGNLFCGVFAIRAVFTKQYVGAAIAILVASVFDSLDGKLARMTKTTSHFGMEYDSLSDVVSFGVAPGFLFYSLGLTGFGRLGWIALFLYIACGAMRLARFNAYNAVSESDRFVGLPIPAAAALMATLVILDDYMLHFGKEVRPIVILSMTYTLAFLMVSTLPYRSFKNLRLRDQKPFSVLVGTVLVMLVLFVEPQIMFFTITLLYVLSGIIEKPSAILYRLAHKKIEKPLVDGKTG